MRFVIHYEHNGQRGFYELLAMNRADAVQAFHEQFDGCRVIAVFQEVFN
jgi:hypothetical protein